MISKVLAHIYFKSYIYVTWPYALNAVVVLKVDDGKFY